MGDTVPWVIVPPAPPSAEKACLLTPESTPRTRLRPEFGRALDMVLALFSGTLASMRPCVSALSVLQRKVSI